MRKAEPGVQTTGTAPPIVHEVLNSPGQSLDSDTRSFMESRFGTDFGHVRVHANDHAANSASEVGARAYTVKHNIVFGSVEYAPDTATGRRLLAHELTHVMQQGSSGAGSNFAGGSPALQREEVAAAGPPAAAPVSETGGTPAEKPTDAFAEWWKNVAKFEGTLEDWLKLKDKANRYDKGGEANMGITRGTFAQLHAAAGLPDTDEVFAAMTPQHAMAIDRTIWRKSRADKINNPGIALIVADWYWGSTIYAFARIKKVLTAMGYVADMSKVNTTYDDLDSFTIGLINSLPPADLIKAFSDDRQEHITNIIKKDKTQERFEKGWRERTEERRTQAEAFKDVPVKTDDRAVLFQNFMRNFKDGKMDLAVKQLNFFTPTDIEHLIERYIKPLGVAKIAEIHEAARNTEGVGAGANIALITEYRFRVYKAEMAVKGSDWQTAAFFLNGFSREDIQFYFKKWKLTPAQLAELHKGAVEHPELGADGQIAQMTKGSGK